MKKMIGWEGRFLLSVYLSQTKDAYSLLARALALHGVTSLPPIARGAHGKPYFPTLPGLHFNLSHSGEFSLCALSDHPVGADIEMVRPRQAGLPRYCMADGEYAAYLASGGSWDEFYRIWTLKEAWAKQSGKGLGQPRNWPTPPPLPHRSYAGEGFWASVCGLEEPGDLISL